MEAKTRRPERYRVTIYLDHDVRRALRQATVDRDTNVSDLANQFFRRALRLPPPPPNGETQ